MEDIKDLSDVRMVQNDIRYMEPNRDRALGDTDRTGQFDRTPPVEEESEENK